MVLSSWLWIAQLLCFCSKSLEGFLRMRVLLWPSTKACRNWSPHLSALTSYCFSSSLALSGFILSPSWRHAPLQLHATACCTLSPEHDPLWAQTLKSSLKHYLAIGSSFSHPLPRPSPPFPSPSLYHIHTYRGCP